MSTRTTHGQLDLWPGARVRQLLFHRDFDGSCAAAMLLRVFDRPVRLRPVGYELARSWSRLRLEDSAIVDFLFHPGASWWFDHHETSFLSGELRSLYEPDSQHRWATSYPSCPSLIADVLQESSPVLATSLRSEMRQWIHWADRIDAGLYTDAREALFGESPELLINASMSATDPRDADFFCDFVGRVVSGETADTIAASRMYATRWRAWRSQIDAAVASLRESSDMSGGVAVGNLLLSRAPLVRYAIYYLYPACRYGIVLHRTREGARPYKISAGANPWYPDYPRVDRDLGTMLRKHGGGGHAYVGSASFRTAAEATNVLRTLVAQLNAHDANGEAQ